MGCVQRIAAAPLIGPAARQFKKFFEAMPGAREQGAANRVDAAAATCSAAGRMRVLEVVSDPDAIARLLHRARAPPALPPPGQLLLLP
jgi:hypothetical protein